MYHFGSGTGYRGLQYLLEVMSESEATRWEYETLRPSSDETKKEAEDPKAELNQLVQRAGSSWRRSTTREAAPSTSFSSDLPNRVSQYD